MFIAENPKHAFNQANLIFRAAYFRNWKKLMANPTLSVGMFFMKILETLAAFMGLINTIQVIFTEKTLESLSNYEPMKSSKFEKGLISIIVPTLNASVHLKIYFFHLKNKHINYLKLLSMMIKRLQTIQK